MYKNKKKFQIYIFTYVKKNETCMGDFRITGDNKNNDNENKI